MTAILTTPTDFQSVRRAIDVTLDDGITVDADRILPDAVIADQMYAGLAEAEIQSWIPTAFPWPGVLTTGQQTVARNATIQLTAAYVYPAIPAVTQEAFGDHRYHREYDTTEDVVARLREGAIATMAMLMDELEIVPLGRRVPKWRLATASRGRFG